MSWSVVTWEAGLDSIKQLAYIKAYRRFVASIHADSAQLGADFAERKQAINAVSSHVLRLTKAARALRRGNVVGFAKELGIKKRSVRKSASDMGGVWLEYSFGWKPLIQDIYTAVNVIQRPLPFLVAKGKAKAAYSVTINSDNLPYNRAYDRYDWIYRCHLQARISVSNWQAWRANELGLINPLSVAWEVVPFSFVVDWFVPIGNYLQSLTDFVGLTLADSFQTWYGVLDRTRVNIGLQPAYIPYGYTYKARRVDLTRVLSIPSPPAIKSRFTGFYSARGANAIALLTSTLRDLPSVPTSKRRFKMSRDMYNWDRNLF
jgi:hypothetical protein